MYKKVIIATSGLLTTLLILKIYTDSLPAYGVKSRWKKLLLKTLVSDEVPKISVGEAAAKEQTVIFLDSRSKEEYLVSHIKGAQLVGYKDFSLEKVKAIPKEQRLIVYCSIGRRSGEIGRKLMQGGYQNVQNLYGGIFEWVNNEHPVVDSAQNPTNNVHTYNKTWSRWLERGEKLY